MRVLTWNLYHGRAVPPAGRTLLAEFRAAIDAWDWDVALLQEVPPWWPERLPGEARTALTSRNLGLALRRAVAERWPDLIKSNGGGANAILVRGERILEHRTHRLRWLPERRVVHAVRLGSGIWVGNLHAQVHSEQRAQDDVAEAVEVVRGWARGAPFVVGGDLNVREPRAAAVIRLGGHGVDHVLASGLQRAGEARVLERGPLSDHAPVLVEGTPTAVRQEKT
jgi:endonuclease/exonuclease/phosphatase family metal-dependent hydrolase